MSDIFTLRGVNITLQIGEKKYKFADPNFPAKIALQKEMNAVNSDETLDGGDKSLKIYEINKRMVRLHLPDISLEELDGLGQWGMTALLAKILDLSVENFGAIVEKIDSEKKS